MANLKTTRVFRDNLKAWLGGYSRSLNQGGTASSKTYSILQILISIASRAKSPILISVVSESMPHLKRGAIRDFFNILDESQNNNPYWNKTQLVYSRPNWKGVIEFFGADEAAKVRGPRRHILFLNEGNNIPWEAARGLDIRTSIFTFVDWNPVSEFWVHQYQSGDKIVPGWLHDESSAYIHSTYKDAQAAGVLPQAVIDSIEYYKDKDPNWWNIYGLGELGKVEGLVYPFFEQVDQLPTQGLLVYGLDFGFSGDPASLGRHKLFQEEVYSKELFYERGLTNQDIGRKLEELGVDKSDIIWADSSEPKSIEEIYELGYNIQGVKKGPGSVEYGHQKVRQFKQFWTKDSLNCIKEQRNFKYKADKNGILTEATTHAWSHGMDERRYAIMGAFQEPEAESSTIVYDSTQLVTGLELS